MTPADEKAEKPVAAGFGGEPNQQLRTNFENLGLLAHQDDFHSGVTPPLDLEASERKAIHDRLVAIEKDTKSARLARARPLPGRSLNWCCSHFGLAILRRCN